MSKRPELDNRLDGATFKSYYYLKEELVAFCRREGLKTGGEKIELTNRIAHYLDTGAKLSPTSKNPRTNVDIRTLSIDSIIENGFVCSEKHRAFFKQTIGNHFTYNVQFQKWLKENSGQTYRDAIYAYYEILEEKKNSITTIDKQFEYNTYIRDFFADNLGKCLDEAIKCWKYKKSLQGHHRYEKTDLVALEEKE